MCLLKHFIIKGKGFKTLTSKNHKKYVPSDYFTRTYDLARAAKSFCPLPVLDWIVHRHNRLLQVSILAGRYGLSRKHKTPKAFYIEMCEFAHIRHLNFKTALHNFRPTFCCCFVVFNKFKVNSALRRKLLLQQLSTRWRDQDSKSERTFPACRLKTIHYDVTISCL